MKVKFNMLILLLTTTCVFACGLKGKSEKNDFKSDVNVEMTLSIDTFSISPAEIDGCSCYFSNNPEEFKKGEYIYMNDFAQISFLKINGVLTKFTQIEFKNIDSKTTEAKAVSGEFQLVIKVKRGEQSGEETQIQTGTIILTDKSGNRIEKTFYGDCGC